MRLTEGILGMSRLQLHSVQVLMEGNNKGKRAASGSQQQQRQQEQEQPPSPSDMQLQVQPSSSTAENAAASFDESGKLVLDRMTLWFDDPNVKREIKDILQAHYHAPWRTYNEVDDVTKKQWWNLFTKRCTWAAEFEPQVRHEFQSRVGNRLRDMFYKLTHNAGKTLPKWVSETVYKKAQDVISGDETFKKRSAQNKKNRRGGSMENAIEPTHYQGSSSAVQHAKKMAKENEGKLPSPVDLLLRTHFKDVSGKGKVPANHTAKQIAETYQKKLEETSSDGSQRTPDELYWEASGGRSKKGRVKGLGSGADLYYSSSSSSRRSGSSKQYTPSVLSQMKEHLEKHVEKVREEVRAEVEEKVRAEIEEKMRAEFEAMQRTQKEFIEQMMSRFGSDSCSPFQIQRRDSPDDDGSGAGQGMQL